jgi:glycosyltransferase involved in cell wall biosynthesis
MKETAKTYCFVTNLAFSEEPTVKNRLMPYITQVIAQGHKVILVTTDLSVIDEFDSEPFSHILQPCQANRPRSFIKRAIYEWIEARKLLKSLVDLDVEAIVLTIPSMFLLFNASVLKRKNLYLDVRDLTWEYLPSTKPVQLIAKLVFRLLASLSFRFFSSVVVTNATEIEYFKGKNIDALLYFNGITKPQFEDLSQLPEKKSGPFTVSYVGKVGIAQNLETLIFAAELLPNIKFNVVGYGPQCDELQQLVATKKLTNVTFYGNVDWQGVVNCYQQSDVLYAQLQESFSGAMPSKLYQYLNAGRFIIYGGGDQAFRTLANFDHNIAIAPDNVGELVNAIVTARQLCEKEQSFAANIEEIKNNYVRENNVDKVLLQWSK